MTDIPIVIGPEGLQPQAPADINAQIIAQVAAVRPDYTATLPGSLIEDVSSTDTYAAVQCDQALVESVNSLTPNGANQFVLLQLGSIYGVAQGQNTNTQVNVVVSGNNTSVGVVIPAGTIVSDGTNQYTLPTGGVIGQDQSTLPMLAVANNSGSWAVPPNSVTTFVTVFPPGYGLTVTNPNTGIPSAGNQTEGQYRAAVLQSGLVSATGMTRMLKTILGNISGVQARLISVRQSGTNWEVIVGGGDPYQVAYGIYLALFNINNLVGSTLAVTGITNASPMVVTTNLNHGFATGQVTSLSGVTPSAFNYASHAATVIDEKNFSVAIDSTGFGAYSSGGVVTPNLRNVTVDLLDTPDTYAVTFVQPPQQTVTISLTWNTDSTNAVNPAAIQQLGAPALVTYINSIPVGQPINLFTLQDVFRNAIAAALPPENLSRMVFVVSINGIATSPTSGTGLIQGDPESFFFAVQSGMTIVQG